MSRIDKSLPYFAARNLATLATIYNHRHEVRQRTHSPLYTSQVQGAVNGPVSELSNPKGSTVEYANAVVPQQDAIHRCPALIVLKEENNNNNS